MKNSYLLDFPNKLKKIFDKLNENNIKPIIVGGYVRDFFLKKESKDIDVELYGVTSQDQLVSILSEFGTLHSVGKSFGVFKLSIEDYEIDFTLPRIDNKISSGHRGFSITVDNNLNFTEASSRRDFTINAIGFDTVENKFLDPFNGIKDIKNKLLKAVDIDKFSEDPLRVLRLVGFASRFDFNIDKNLFNLCKTISNEGILFELPKERIFIEIEKIFLKSQKPSISFLLLKELEALQYFSAINELNEEEFLFILNRLDAAKKLKIGNIKTIVLLMLSVLCSKFNSEQIKNFVTNITNKKSLLDEILSITDNSFKISYSDTELYKLATKVNIEHFLLYAQAINPNIEKSVFLTLKQKASELGILNKKKEAILKGKDLIKHGLSPSKNFSIILDDAYNAQINLQFSTYNEAQIWLSNYLKQNC